MFSVAVITLGLTIPTQASDVPDALRQELRLLSQDVAKIIEKKGGGAIALGEISGSVDVVGHAGPGIQLVLAEELRNAGLSVDNSRFRFELSGRYQPFKDSPINRKLAGGRASDASNLYAVKLVAFLIDRDTGEPLAERPTGRLIFGRETVPAMLGLNLSHPPLRDPRDISDQIERARKEKQISLSGTEIRGLTGQYAIAILVKKGTNYVAQPVRMQGSHPFVDLNESDIYGVRLINNSKHEAAVDLRIDGVGCFAFSSSKSKYWLVAPGEKVDILGWHRDQNVTTEFKVVSNFPDTAAAKLNLRPSPSIGLITASFSACWPSDSSPPSDEPLLAGRGTGFGDDLKIKTQSVARTIGQTRDTLSVRYER
ncbi:MAG: hypothetical protein Tsb009_10800 [Planctomycetaceae bacterium]